MALVDADYKFCFANVREEGSNSDAGVFQVCTRTLGLPPKLRSAACLKTDRNTPYPSYIVGDYAFDPAA